MGAVAVGCGLFALYLCQSRTAPFNSDGAANVLQGQAIVTGNPLLRGWWTSDVSFYTTELPEYALVTAIRGLAPDVVHRCGALTYTLTVILAALVARGGAVAGQSGRAGWRRAAIAAGIMLAPSILGGTEVFLEYPDHAGTAVPVFLVLLTMARAGRRLGSGAYLAKVTVPAGGATGHYRGSGRGTVPATRPTRPLLPRFARPFSWHSGERGSSAANSAVADPRSRQGPGERPSTDRITARSTERWLGPTVICLLLALAQVGDELTLVAATVPLAAVCAVRLLKGGMLRGRVSARRVSARRVSARRVSARGGQGGGQRRDDASSDEALFDRALLAAAVASVGLAKLAEITIRALGGFDLRPLGGANLAPLRQVPANAGVLWQSLILLFGANNPGTPRQARTIKAHAFLVGMADLHVIGLLLASAGLVAGIASWRKADRVTQVLVMAIIAVLAAGTCTTVLRSLSNAHEVAILLPLSAALAGRALPGSARRLSARQRSATVPGLRCLPSPSRLGAACGRSAAIATVALGAWLAVSLAELCYAAAWPATPPPQQAVAAWLVSHHERVGLAGYWQADATTVTSGDQVLVAPITLPAPAKPAKPANSVSAATGQASADRWESSAAWYQPGQHDATFVIAVTSPSAPGGGLSPAAVSAGFGPPAAQHQVGQDVIMLYRYNLLTRLRGTAFPGVS